jgi:outer membrane protein OmpA-like peptidoglycan-associated protein
MNKLIQSIKVFPNSRIEVNGHTDATGDDKTNQILSQQRAEKVAMFIKEVGEIPGERITAQGHGELKPVATNETAEGRAANRRVEIVIVNGE